MPATTPTARVASHHNLQCIVEAEISCFACCNWRRRPWVQIPLPQRLGARAGYVGVHAATIFILPCCWRMETGRGSVYWNTGRMRQNKDSYHAETTKFQARMQQGSSATKGELREGDRRGWSQRPCYTTWSSALPYANYGQRGQGSRTRRIAGMQWIFDRVNTKRGRRTTRGTQSKHTVGNDGGWCHFSQISAIAIAYTSLSRQSHPPRTVVM